MRKVFVSYRRTDDPAAATLVYEQLASKFGREAIYFDVDSVPPGVDFVQHIQSALDQTDVLVVVIGDRWIAADDQNSRLEDPLDFVRIEIETALGRDIPTIPVLVGNASMPTKSELPDAISDLALRNACEVRTGATFRSSMDRLIAGIEQVANNDGLASIDSAGSSAQPAQLAPESTEKKGPAGWLPLVIGVFIGVAVLIFVGQDFSKTPELGNAPMGGDVDDPKPDVQIGGKSSTIPDLKHRGVQAQFDDLKVPLTSKLLFHDTLAYNRRLAVWSDQDLEVRLIQASKGFYVRATFGDGTERELSWASLGANDSGEFLAVWTPNLNQFTVRLIDNRYIQSDDFKDGLKRELTRSNRYNDNLGVNEYVAVWSTKLERTPLEVSH